MTARPPKERLFAMTGRIPLVGEGADPFMFVVLMAVAIIAVVVIVFAHDIFPTIGTHGVTSYRLSAAYWS